MTGPGPLAGVRVVEMEAIGPAPFACMLLSDLGADVIRIARPPGATQEAAHRGTGKHVVFHRGRPALPLDLKSTEGRERVLRLVACADALIEGFRPGVMERLSLGPAECAAVNPSLVYGRMTGWGQDGPLAQTAGHDINYLALTGALHAIGPKDGPVPPLNLVGDFGGGSLYLALGIVSALFAARSTRKGQVVDAAIVDGTVSLMAMVFGRWSAGLWRDERGANLLDGGTPWYRTYGTSDGRHVAVGAIEPQFWEALRRGLGAPDLPDAQARHDRAQWPQLAAQLQAIFAQRPRDHWARLFEATDACVSPVLSIAEVAGHPHNAARGNVIERDGVLQPDVAPRLSLTPGAFGREPEESGEERERRWLQADR